MECVQYDSTSAKAEHTHAHDEQQPRQRIAIQATEQSNALQRTTTILASSGGFFFLLVNLK
jgi:hypothetical protein